MELFLARLPEYRLYFPRNGV